MTHTDSQVVLKQIYRGELSRRTKYLRLAFEAVKGHLAEGHINLDHIDGKDNPSDLCTKPLPLEDFARHTNFLLNDSKAEFGEWHSCLFDREY